ncbi:TonB-dependent receptor [Pontixanthobacter aestiaquae]|uniref:TonB-dependent receptor n=1 Tax=Pontixanthobacter aestiaquae TaxID=1509367 RepID=A0A844Z1I4_9SPHN|nr:TonB-dependent receptor [Pontixanthobacter aestiaquae]MDN3647229.1 TonB-dependent receptor [Pontixanthobacter aestiaquae]MXO81795.1 TonB-dependent receptor [Pontixanthobacter aestiaquae]
MRKIAFGTASSIAMVMVMGAPAYAQSTDEPEAEESPAATEDVIVVTAERREQSLQDYAGTAAVFKGDDLRARGIQDITDFNDELPGLTVANNGGNVEIWIRGVGSSNNTELGDPAAAFHYDGVYVPRPSGIGSAFFDIERVEVNVGPQGTLRGRNALAGSVNAISWKPGLGVWDANLEVGYGNYDHKEFRGMINVPVGDNAAFRVSGMYLGHDSYYNNVGPIQNVDVAEQEDNKAIRAQFLWEPTERLSILLAGDYIHEEGTGYTGTNYAGPLGNGILPEEIEDPRDVIGNAFTPILDTKHYGLRATITYEADPFTVEFTSSYRDLVYNYDANAPLTPFYPGVIGDLSSRGEEPNTIIDDIILQENLDNFSRFQFITDSESYYNELRIFNNEGPFIWSLGGMYFKENQYAFLASTGDRGLFFQGIEFNNPDVNAESWSIYGDATFEINDRFRITGGLRWTDDQKSRRGVAARYGLALGDGNFNCCMGVRYGTEGFEFAGRDRTIFDPDTNGDGNVSNEEIFAFQLNGVRQFGLRDNLDDILNFGPLEGHFDDVPGAVECLDTVSFDGLVCDGFANTSQFTYAVPFRDQIFLQDGEIKDDFIDWRLRLEYDITPDNLVYALVASGHKSGTFNDNLGSNGFFPTTETENVILYEFGTKNEFWIGDVKAKLNGSAFYNDYQDQAFSALLSVETIADFELEQGEVVDIGDDVSLALIVGYTFNAADSEIYGLNVEGGLELPANLNWDFNLLWLEAKIKDSQEIPDGRFQPDVEAVPFRNIAGKRLPRTPRWQLNTSLSQNIDVSSGSIDWVISAGYRSDTFQTIFNSEDYEQPNNPRLRLNDVVKGYWTFDLGAGYSHGDDGKFRFEVYANNVTNKQKESAIIITQFDNTRFFTRPRTYGARMRVNF